VRLTTSHRKTKLFRNQTVSLGIEKNGGRLFGRPKLTLSCSAEGKKESVTCGLLKILSVTQTT
jgi:hypothetical protein